MQRHRGCRGVDESAVQLRRAGREGSAPGASTTARHRRHPVTGDGDPRRGDHGHETLGQARTHAQVETLVGSPECGIEPTPHAAGGGRFPVKYYLVAMLFIVIDIESVFLIPYAVAFDQLKLFGLVEMVLFIVTVFVAYAYVWRRGGLEWD